MLYGGQPLTLSAHVTALCRSGYYQLRVRQLRPLVQSMTVEAARTATAAFISCRLDSTIRCCTGCRTLYCASFNLCRMPLHDWSLARDARVCITLTPLATHPRARKVQNGMPFWTLRAVSPVAVLASLLGRRLPSRVRQHSGRSLWSAGVSTCMLPLTLSSYGDWTFAAAGPRLCNSLLVQLRNPDISYGLFRRQFLYREALCDFCYPAP